ncbi:KLH20 protein, partial [Polypterus senegalus]
MVELLPGQVEVSQSRETSSWQLPATHSTQQDCPTGTAIPRLPHRCANGCSSKGMLPTSILRVERYDTQTHEWRRVTSMPKPCHDFGTGVLDGQVYTVGGHDGTSYLSSVERYNPATNEWSSNVASLSVARSGIAVAVIGGYLYALGGFDGITPVSTVERYDPQMNMWFRVAPMNARRTGAAVAVLEGYLYVIGGSDGSSPLNSVERYNPVEDCWHHCPSLSSWREKAGCAVYRNMIYVAGGKDERLELNTVERFNPESNQWSTVRPMQNKRNQALRKYEEQAPRWQFLCGADEVDKSVTVCGVQWIIQIKVGNEQ